MCPRPQGMSRRWPRLPRRTARLRLTVLYGGLFLACGAVLLVVTYVLVKVTGDPSGSGSRPAAQILRHSGPSGSGLHMRLPASLWADHLSAYQVQQLESAMGEASAVRTVNAVLGEMLARSPIALAIVTVVALAVGWVVAGRILRPLTTITTAARRISASKLNQRLSLPGPDDELKALGDTLDDLFARLEASFRAQRHFIANASHELRTPITRERAMLQVALDDPATTAETWRATTREVLASNAEQESLIDALLTLATGESGLGHHEPVDLGAVAGTVLLTPRPEIGNLGLHIEATTQPATLHGDRLLAERLVANLIDNAVRHNIPGGSVQVTTANSRGHAVLSVANTGPVIPPGQVDQLFQPFQRLNARDARNGSSHGLGLSIVRAIAAAHSGSITTEAPSGGGLIISIAFPHQPIPAPKQPNN